ncbi:MAG: hypothetical protein Q4G68_01455 [Planctomycetia bacterium]|nr:hypothetical protein [Planctomycetia bacterium]
MARILAVDWDSEQIRFLLGNVTGDSVTIVKAGCAYLGESVGRGVSAEGVSNEGRDESELDSAPSDVKPHGPEVGQVLKSLLRQEHVGKGELALALARSDVEVLYLTLPVVSEGELPDLVQNQVLRESTTYLEGQPLDFLPLGLSEKDKALRVMSVSMTRIQLDETRLSLQPASRRPKRLEFRPLALYEFFRAGVIPLPREADSFSTAPVLILQEVADEVNLLVYGPDGPVYVRAFKRLSKVSGEEMLDRLAAEIRRTLSTSFEEENAPEIHRLIAFGSDDDVPFFSRLEAKLAPMGLEVVMYNPFEMSGISCQCQVPDEVGRYAPLVGMLLASRKKTRPVLDLLHPRQKPKPPNYPLMILVFLLISGLTVASLWWLNERELSRRAKELAALEKEKATLIGQIRQVSPAWQVLSRAKAWDRNQGVLLLDELRDLTLRIPKAPDLTITRLAWSNAVRNRTAFIISGKVTSLAVYQQFYFALTSDKSHTIVTAGPKVLTNEGGFTHEFSVQVFCHARSWNDFYKQLPAELQKISNNYPEQWLVPVTGTAPGTAPGTGSQPVESVPEVSTPVGGSQGTTPAGQPPEETAQ